MTIKPEVIPLIPHHLEMVDLQEESLYLLEHLDNINMSLQQYGEQLLEGAVLQDNGSPSAWSYLVDGEILGCAGLVHTSMPHIVEAWMINGKHSRRYFRLGARYTRDVIGNCQYDRIQAFADKDFKRAHRFLQWLGFQKEGILRKSGVNKEDNIIFSIVRD